MRNIRAFETLSIDFRDVTAAALVGQNGAGKSTITEGILRALYSDGPSILPNSMIRLGADSGSIELEYIHNGQKYRIVRVGGKRSDVQFLLSDGNGGWQPLSGATSKETQEKINASLAMDEDLFLSSCCVMQGKSAGICTARPAERKAVMYRIYDKELSKFAALHDGAKRHVVDLDNQLGAGRTKRADLEQRIAAKAEHEESKARAIESLQSLGMELATAEAELTRLREAAARSQADREKLESLTKQVDELQREVDALQSRIADHDQTIRECDALLSQADDIRAQCEQADRLEKELEHFTATYEQYSSLGQAYLQMCSERDAEVRRTETEWREQIDVLKGNVTRLRAERLTLDGSITAKQQSLDAATRQATLIDEVPCGSGPMAETCKLLADARVAKEAVEALQEQLWSMQGLSVTADLAIDGAAEALGQADTEMASAIEATRTRLQAEVDNILRQKDTLGYDKAEHAAKLSVFNECKQAREKLAGLAAAESRRESAISAKANDEHSRDGKLVRLEDIQNEAGKLADGLDSCDADRCTTNLDAVVAQLKRDIDTQTRAMASAETVLGQIAEAEAEIATLNKTLSANEHQRTLWATLQEAYSRDGIPALIIDAAIPQIEEYANDLLTRLSDGRMSLRFATQKRTGSGSNSNIAETLDIFVSDGSGERAYEDFSGGEQLRVNLSVRIAIGQVLAQRAGATIRTLLLDEVCSPLDQAGEDALVECIAKLQSMFDCILLVTHRDSLKDRLPQQIEVIKGTNGSEIRVA